MSYHRNLNLKHANVMRLTTHKSSNSALCAFCAFRKAIWTSSSVRNGGSKIFIRSLKQYPLRRFRFEGASNTTTAVEPETAPRLSRRPLGSRSKLFEDLKIALSGRDFTRRDGQGSNMSYATAYETFTKLIIQQWNQVKESFSYWPIVADQVGFLGIKSEAALHKWLAKFDLLIQRSCHDAVELRGNGNAAPDLVNRLRGAFLDGNVPGLTAALKYSFDAFVLNHGFTEAALENHRKVADLRYPTEWFPEARAMQRKIHLHVGPTNSGKTYQALKRLEAAETGVYAGPLRLLAHEVYTRLNAKNKRCALITGEERRIPEGPEPSLISCTVEMVPLEAQMDVAVIDEIQMMGDSHRGWAWTQAFLGVKAKEVHLCGETRTVPLIKHLCAVMGDALEVHDYERLSPLKAMTSSLRGDIGALEKGDAIILFSRYAIHTMKKEIERSTGKRCAVVYGSLPPETRAQQANLFNDPNNDYDFLVASDAVGMGLNLSIRRIIFETTGKMDDVGFRALEISEIKQIAGRAGRYRTAAQAVEDSIALPLDNSFSEYPLELDTLTKKLPNSVGLVTTLQDYDLPIMQRAMLSEAPSLATAGIFAPDEVIARFAAYFPERTPFSYILLRLHEISSVNPGFHLCKLKEHLLIADAIQEYDLTINDRILFASAPASFRREGMESVLKALAKCVADQSSGELLDIKEINLDVLDQPVDTKKKEYLRSLEDLHSALTLYLWLSYRFAGVFRSQALAFHAKSLVEEKIDECLSKAEMDPWKKKWMKVLQTRAVNSSTKAAPTATGAEEDEEVEEVEDDEDYTDVGPFTVLVRASYERDTLVTMPRYENLGRVGGDRHAPWQVSVSVVYAGDYIEAKATASKKDLARTKAASSVLKQISLGKKAPKVASQQKSDTAKDPRIEAVSSYEANASTAVLAERISDTANERQASVRQ